MYYYVISSMFKHHLFYFMCLYIIVRATQAIFFCGFALHKRLMSIVSLLLLSFGELSPVKPTRLVVSNVMSSAKTLFLHTYKISRLQ